MATAGKGDLQLSIGASIDELNKVVVQARAAFESLAQSAQASSRRTGAGAKESEKSFSSLGESMKRFAAEERSEGRAAGFFVGELTKIIPASNSVRIGLGALAEILIGGAGVGAALAIVGAGAEMLRDHFEEAKKKSEEFARKLDEVRAIAEKADLASRKLRMVKGGVGENAAAAITSEDTKKLDEAMLEAQTQRRVTEQQLERFFGSVRGAQYLRDQGKSLQEIAKVYPTIAGHVKDLGQQEQVLAEVETARARVTAASAAADREDARQRSIASAERVASLQSQTQLLTALTQVRQLQIEQERALDALETKKKTAHADELAGLDREIAATRALYAEKLRIARIREQFATATPTEDMGQALGRTSGQVVSDADAARYMQHYPTFADQRAMQQPYYGHTASEYADSFSAAEIAAGGTEDQHLAASKAAEEQQKQIQALSASYQQWGAAAGNVIGGLITGHKSLGETMAQVGQMIIQQVVQAAITSITADAARAGAGAAASQSGIPVVGPVLAVAAMGAIMASVMSLLGNVPSAAGGWKVPHDTLAMVHEDERILPARYSRGLDRLVEGGGPGPLIGTVVATDASSFGRQLLNRDSDLVRGLEKAARRRRRAGV